MTETDFILSDKTRAAQPWCQTTGLRFRAVDGVLVLVFLAAFLGLVFLLSK